MKGKGVERKKGQTDRKTTTTTTERVQIITQTSVAFQA